ncbi:MAG: CotH kinase family protein [Planctomycetaceae bacterium]|jgi:spore coat protein CotH
MLKAARCMSLFALLGVTIWVGPWTPTCLVAQESAIESPLTTEQLFDGQRLLQVEIEIDSEKWNELRQQTLDFVTAFSKGPISPRYTYFPATVKVDGRVLGKAAIRKKGFFGSMDADRPSLKVKLDAAGQRLMGGLEKLTLNNNKQDRSLASQFLAYRLFAAAGLPAPRSSLAVVSVNGESLGVYTHLESVDSPFLRGHFGSDTGHLYEGVFPTDFFDDRIDRFEGKQKGEDDRDDLRQIASILANPGNDYVARLSQRIDLDQFVKFWAIESLLGFWDGYANNQNNYYIYHDPRDDRFRFVPWGADMTLSPPFFPGQGGKKSVYAKGQLAWQLNQDPGFRQRYHDTLLQLVEETWKEEPMLAELDRIQELVSDHLHPAQQGNSQAVESARKFIQERRREILDELKDGPVHIEKQPAKPFYMREAGRAQGEFSTTWSPAEAKEPAASDKVTFTLILNGDPVEFEQVTAISRPSPPNPFGGPPGPPPPQVVLRGTRGGEKKPLLLMLTIPPDQFTPGTDKNREVGVQGMLTEGEGFGFGPGMRSFLGKIELKSASQEAGKPVVGKISGTIYEMRGGFGF